MCESVTLSSDTAEQSRAVKDQGDECSRKGSLSTQGELVSERCTKRSA